MAVSHAPRLAGAVWLSLFATRQLFGCGVGIFKSIERRWPCGSSPPPSFARIGLCTLSSCPSRRKLMGRRN